MWRHAQVLGPFLGVLLAGTAVQVSTPAFASDTEAKLLKHLEHEHKPVKRAKLEVRLGKLKLEQAFEDYKQGNFQVSQKSLNEYLERMRNAWAELESSGRIAARKPQGFKELEIALRESRRKMEDFESRISYQQRQQVEKIRLETERLHRRVLDTLFPGMIPAAKEQQVAGKKGPLTTGSKEPQ
jgi:DNA-directed RNA polymerase subunit K/omega